MGVCCIVNHPGNENIILSGSYDENIAVWDKRNWNKPLSCTFIGGGIWRLKFDPHDSSYLGVACMYEGFKVVKFPDSSASQLQVIAEMKHDSIAYGIDWDPLHSGYLGTCSFYDQTCRIWNVSNLLH